MKILKRRNNKLKVKSLCKVGQVSRSGYYNHIKETDNKLLRELKDKEDFGLILSIYKHKGFNKGVKSIKMRLSDDLNKRAYLFVIKDAVTNEAWYVLSKSLDMKFVIKQRIR